MLKARLLALATASSFALVSMTLVVSAGSPNDPVVITQDFSHDPASDGWKTFGNSNLFTWNSTDRNLDVTWNSTQPNSYFYFPLHTILTRSDNFAMSFDLVIKDVIVSGFELSIGFLNINSATNAGFLRGTGSDSPNLAEFDYFPPTDWDGGVSSTFAATNNWNAAYNSPICSGWTTINLPTGVPLHVNLSYTGNNSTAVLTVTGENVEMNNTFQMDTNFTDWRLNAFAVESYNETGAWGGSILAHGTVKNVKLTLPPAPIQNLRGSLNEGTWQVNFDAQANWEYTLERTSDFKTWTEVSPMITGNSQSRTLQDTNSTLPSMEFYRVKALRN